MLDQLENLIAQYSKEAVNKTEAVPADKKEQVSQAASNSVMEFLKDKATSQDFSSLVNMLKGDNVSGIASSDLGGNFMKKLSDLGINPKLATTIVSAVMPMILSKVSGNSGGGGMGDILGKLTKGGDLGSALGGILGKQSSSTKGNSDLGGALGKLKDLF